MLIVTMYRHLNLHLAIDCMHTLLEHRIGVVAEEVLACANCSAISEWARLVSATCGVERVRYMCSVLCYVRTVRGVATAVIVCLVRSAILLV